jgi:hypothetical protein
VTVRWQSAHLLVSLLVSERGFKSDTNTNVERHCLAPSVCTSDLVVHYDSFRDRRSHAKSVVRPDVVMHRIWVDGTEFRWTMHWSIALNTELDVLVTELQAAEERSSV